MKDFIALILAILIISGVSVGVVCMVLLLYGVAVYIHSKSLIGDVVKWIL